MSKNIGDGDGIEKALYETIKKRLTKNNILGETKAKLLTKVIELINEDDNKGADGLASKDLDSPTCLVNQLIFEYLKWMDYKYSGKMITTESGREQETPREKLEENFQQFKNSNKEVPLLLEIIMSNMNENK